ncbi:DUF397 domain-containing protein [Micromonospora sp. LOL_023]|uniref:DUF397 domain-containing protein n=1 Tax=Micromonospora sp. LOL_023 TaxID=3345418 RepID=UPI003A88C6C7
MSRTDTFDRDRAVWRKSTRSNGNSGDCVEVADNQPGAVGVRDSKDQHGPALVFAPSAWAAFTHSVRAGR